LARRDKRGEKEVARQRVARLVELAEAAILAGRQDRADRYAKLAWRVKTTYQLRGSAIDKRLCRACQAFRSAATSRARVRDGVRVVTCLVCGDVSRRPLGPRRGGGNAPKLESEDPRSRAHGEAHSR